MYFLEQIKGQLICLVTVSFEWTKWVEAIDTQAAKPTEVSKTPDEVLSKAKETNRDLDKTVNIEQERIAKLSWEVNETLWDSKKSWWEQLQEWISTKELLSSISFSESELNWVKSEFPWEVSEEILMQRVLENKLKAYHNWGLPDEDREMINTLFHNAGIKDIPLEISIDSLQNWEVDDIGKEVTPEELENVKEQVGDEVNNLDLQIAKLPQGPEREVLEKRRGLIGTILDALEGKTHQWWVWGMWFAWVESNGSHNVVSTAKNHLWIHENSWKADKFLMWLAQDARKTPWCAGFVSYVCKEAWYDIIPTLSSKAFIWETGKWHVAFNIWWWKMLWWNQSNEVSIQSINKPVKWWIMPEDYASWKSAQKSWDAPVWAIIVFDRWSSQKSWA